MANKDLEKIRKELDSKERQKKRCEDSLKRLEAEKKKLTKNGRTHQLCTWGAMLSAYLVDPTLLEDEDVAALLKLAFNPIVRQQVKRLVDERRRALVGLGNEENEGVETETN
ncbi:MAG: DUF3847 domain-containing protein [Oscillospiraceae bacterium]|nr:DUF3847 domain-containing protein [Oscillospiraceae bacterium]MCD8230966.1 DUF3847 domain-containing protein [Clostridiales bacterium]